MTYREPMLGAIIGIVAVVVLLALGVYLTRGRRDAPGSDTAPEVSGPYFDHADQVAGPSYGELTANDPHPARDYIGAEPDDLSPPDAQSESELWQRERERYRDKDQRL